MQTITAPLEKGKLMDSKQIHNAMRKRVPVIYEGVEYDRILEYVSWYDDQRKHRLSVVLLSGRNSVRVPAEKVEDMEQEVKEEPAVVDAAPVVRCRDCKYFGLEPSEQPSSVCGLKIPGGCCPQGERREDASY